MIGGIQNLLQVGAQWRAELCITHQHLTVAADDCQQIIEVVCYAARELTDGFHLL